MTYACFHFYCMNLKSHQANLNTESTFDSCAFESLFKLHYKWLCFIANEITCNWQTAEDVTQEFFVRYWQNRDSVTMVDNFRAYAAKCVRNAAINSREKNNVRQNHETQVGRLLDTEIENAALHEEDERYYKLLHAIEQLPPQRKKIFLLFHFEELKAADIARQQQLTVDTVRTHIKHAYRTLRDSLLFLIGFLLVW